MQIKTRVIIVLVIIFLGLCLGVYFWLKVTGRLRTGAEAVIGCQGSNQISQFFGSPGSNLISYNLFGSQIMIHERVAPYLNNIQKDVVALKTGYNFTNITSYNNRWKIFGGGRSLHSWGIAIDINPETNPYQSGNYGPPQTDIPPEIIKIFQKYGFVWGGDWPGERDPMHFEWYGAEISGQILDKTSSQRIISVATDVDGAGSPNANGEYSWIVPFGSHIISAKARGYQDITFAVSLACFSGTTMDILMEPLASNIGGSIAGRIRIANNYPLLMPASIYLDGRAVGITNLRGDYLIPNVHEGKHTIEARILFFPGGLQKIETVPGENLKNVNILIGR